LDVGVARAKIRQHTFNSNTPAREKGISLYGIEHILDFMNLYDTIPSSPGQGEVGLVAT